MNRATGRAGIPPRTGSRGKTRRDGAWE